MSAPTVTVSTFEGSRDVVFDFNRLVVIEETCGVTIGELARELATFIPTGEDEIEEASKRFRLSTVQRFIGGCLDLDRAQVQAQLGIAGIKPAFVALMGGFFESIEQFNAKDAAAADPPAPAPAG